MLGCENLCLSVVDTRHDAEEEDPAQQMRHCLGAASRPLRAGRGRWSGVPQERQRCPDPTPANSTEVQEVLMARLARPAELLESKWLWTAGVLMIRTVNSTGQPEEVDRVSPKSGPSPARGSFGESLRTRGQGSALDEEMVPPTPASPRSAKHPRGSWRLDGRPSGISSVISGKGRSPWMATLWATEM